MTDTDSTIITSLLEGASIGMFFWAIFLVFFVVLFHEEKPKK